MNFSKGDKVQIAKHCIEEKYWNEFEAKWKQKIDENLSTIFTIKALRHEEEDQMVDLEGEIFKDFPFYERELVHAPGDWDG